MGFIRACMLPIMLLAMTVPATSQSLLGQEPAGKTDGAIGIVVNETVTAAGQEFYRNFTEFWREKPEGENYALGIFERPSRRFGNQISIVYGQQRIFLSALPVKLDRVRALSEQAADAAYANIISLGLFSPSFSDPDLGHDEL